MTMMTLVQATFAAVLPSLLLDCCLTFSEPFWPVWVSGLLTPTRSTNTTAWPSMPWLLHVRNLLLERSCVVWTLIVFTVIALTLAAIIYPVQFSKDLANGRTFIKFHSFKKEMIDTIYDYQYSFTRYHLLMVEECLVPIRWCIYNTSVRYFLFCHLVFPNLLTTKKGWTCTNLLDFKIHLHALVTIVESRMFWMHIKNKIIQGKAWYINI